MTVRTTPLHDPARPPALGNVPLPCPTTTIDATPSASQSPVGLLDPEKAAMEAVLVFSIPGEKD